MAKKYFGTDGIRGAVNSKNINGDMFFKFGLATGTYFKTQKKKKQIAIIAKDTRLSGYTLEPALVSGLTSAGMHVYTLGPLPTNGLAMLTKAMKANMGIMITASHNPYYDNGLKLFGPDGLKLSDKIEKKIESLIDKKIANNLSKSKKLGRVKRLESANQDYINILKKNFSKEFNLRGLSIVIDCANGAGYKAGPELLKSLGAKVIAIGIKPNGLNINKNCGSTYPNKIKFAVRKNKAHIGISLDGDADRIIMCDEKGSIIDGDQIIAALAIRWKRKKMLRGGVVGTLMSNYGLEKFFKLHKIKFVRANVGDRYVKEKMQKNNFNLEKKYSILLAVDDSPGTEKAVKYGVRVAQAFNIKIDIITISKDGHFGEGYSKAVERTKKMMRRCNIETKIFRKVGDPVQNIVETAGENHIIIMGASTQSPITKFFIGSKPLNVIEKSNCPVLIVK